MPRLDPLPLEDVPGLEPIGQMYESVYGFVPNGVRIMARRPAIVEGFLHLRRSVMDPATSTVPPELKNLVSLIASKTHGCRYCQAHAVYGADRAGFDRARLAAVWEYESSDLFTEGERVALQFAVDAAAVPNGVTDDSYDAMREHWSEGQIVEILAVVALFGFLNRWNDSLGTPLEDPSHQAATQAVGAQGWAAGKHRHDDEKSDA